ncbi:MAG TPA: tetratricopeptide repeat protein [Terriglobales bacterium]|nr:tetratricopeptide repeat protein [Terriglobales bacterium]
MLLKKPLWQTRRLNIAAVIVLASGATNLAQAQKSGMPSLSPAEQTAQESSTQPEAELQKGIELTRSGRFAEAIPHFLAARGGISSEYAAEFDLALCYVGTGQAEEAIRLLSELQKRGYENVSVENLLAQADAKAGRSKEAMEALRRAAQFTPKDAKLYIYVADAFLERGEDELSLQAIDFGLKHLPDSARLHYERGYLLTRLDETDAAKAAYERAVGLAPHSEIGYLAEIEKNLLAGNISQAVEAARTGIREGREDYQLLAALGDSLLRSGAKPGDAEFTEAKNALEKSVAARPTYANSQILLGHLYLLEGSVDKAVEHLEAGRRLDSQNFSVYPLLAKAYQKQGQTEKAAMVLATLAKMNQEQAQKIRTAPGDSKAIPGAARPEGSSPQP